MLKPIKTFLTYLQRNANSSNIFGLTTTPTTTSTMGPTEQPRLEESIMIASEELGNDSGGDPLYDPLALDDDCTGGGVAEGAINLHDVAAIASGADGDDDGEGQDGVTSGKIILVDVSSLKSSLQPSSELVETDNEDMTDVVVKEEKEEMEEVELIKEAEDDAPEDSSSAERLAITSASGDCVPANGRSIECMIEVNINGGADMLDSLSPMENDSFKVTASPETVASSVTIKEEVQIEEPPIDELMEETLPNGHDDAVAGGRAGSLDEVDTISSNLTTDDQQQIKVEASESVESSAAPPEPIQGTLPVKAGEAEAEVEEEEASDGSDSGLGLEPSRTVPGTGANSSNGSTSAPLEPPPVKSSLKRRSEPSSNAPEVDEEGASREKRSKKAITFDGVTVYYFPRIQGFGCVPTQGGCTLGMDFQHVHSRRLTLAEHSSEQRRVHRAQLQELNPRSSSSDDTSSEEEPSESGSEAESESYGFLQPVTTRQRRALLKAAGVRKIDSTEKDECREIRTSREVCGCTCRTYCNPATCACSLAGIKCQVDRPSFPCGCTHEGCANKTGRVEFNPGRVRTHFLHTIMRLTLEGKANEVRRPSASPIAGGSSAVDGGVSSVENGYVAGSEKNWSNGPIRLPQQQPQPQQQQQEQPQPQQQPQQQQHDMAYVHGAMHAVPSAGPSGIGTNGALVAMNHLHHHHHHHHSLSPPYHQSMPMHHHQFFAQPVEESYMADAASYHQQQDYPGPNAQHSMLLVTPPSGNSPSAGISLQHHLIDGLISPISHPTGPVVEVLYAYRDAYYGPAGTSSGGTVSEQVLSPHDQLGFYAYGGERASSSGGADEMAGSCHPNPHPHHAMHQLPEAAAAGSISPYHQHQQHTVPTGHDRVDLVTSGHGGEGGGTPSVNGEQASCHMLTTPPLNSADGSNYAELASEAPFPDSNQRSFPPVEKDPPNDLTADSTALSDSSSQDLVLVESETSIVTVDSASLSSSSSSVIAIDDECVDDRDAAAAKPTASNDATSSSSFTDLTAPNAGNAERLEAINDMLASSRRWSANLARRSIAAEDDDELRDFRHSPVPPAVTIDSSDEDDVAEGDGGQQVVIVVERPQRHAGTATIPVNKTMATTRIVVNGGDDNAVRQRNGLEAEQADSGPNVVRTPDEKRSRRDGVLLARASLTNGNDGCTSMDATADSAAVGSSRVAIKQLAKPHTGVDDPSTTSNSTAPGSSSGAGGSGMVIVEPSENLCEIIKSSIVETAVSH